MPELTDHEYALAQAQNLLLLRARCNGDQHDTTSIFISPFTL